MEGITPGLIFTNKKSQGLKKKTDFKAMPKRHTSDLSRTQGRTGSSADKWKQPFFSLSLLCPEWRLTRTFSQVVTRCLGQFCPDILYCLVL